MGLPYDMPAEKYEGSGFGNVKNGFSAGKHVFINIYVCIYIYIYEF